jgi:hypothetical protein
MQPSIQPSPAESQFPEQQASGDLVKLIRKLRWIGMEDEAQQLQLALRRFPTEQAEIVLADAPSTD